MFDINSFQTKLMKMYFEFTSKWRKALVILLEYISLAPTFVPKVVSDYNRRIGDLPRHVTKQLMSDQNH